MLRSRSTGCEVTTAPRRRGGFTLFEIVLALAILVIASALVYPSFSAWFHDQKLQEGTDAFQTGCVNARTRAMEEGRICRVVPETPGTFGYAPLVQSELEDYLPNWTQTVALPVGVEFVNTDWVIDFQPDGTARILVEGEERQQTYVVLRETARQRVLKVRALSGAVTIVPRGME
jgi:prepilin-type N-terminal cleavage/methylation domain-containing protein